MSMQSFARKNARRAASSRCGVTLKKSVRDTWAHVFAENEKKFDDGKKPLTDLEISAFMQNEFPTGSKASKSVGRVRMYRSCYNKGSHSFKALGEPDVQSREFNSDGKPIEATARRSGVNESRIREIVKDEIGNRPVINITFTKTKVSKVDTADKHAKFADVMLRISAGLPVLLVGPTGSGKTHLAAQVADSLGLPFTQNSMSEGVSESALVGRTLPDENGVWQYCPAPFVETFKNGGVHLFDEIDAADPNLLVTVNTALANRVLAIPFSTVELIKQHPKCFLIAAANTFGKGADRQYVGRNPLDESTLNRYTMGTIEVDYDVNIEKAIVDAILGKDATGKALLEWCWHIRSRIESHGLRRVMSTRSIKDGAALIKAGGTLDIVKQSYFLGWNDDERRRVQ